MQRFAFVGTLFCAGFVFALTGCSSTSQQIVRAIATGQYGTTYDPTENVQTNPAFRYLRVEKRGAPAALLVLGYVDAHPEGSVEVWYSSKGEVIRLQNGRIVGTAGLAFDWPRVWFGAPLPSWLSVPPQGLTMTRWHDEKKGYVSGIEQRLKLQTVSQPQAWPSKLPKGEAADYQWFQESELETDLSHLPPALYALGTYQGQRRIVYSEQCLSSEMCLKLQLWPAQVGKL